MQMEQSKDIYMKRPQKCLHKVIFFLVTFFLVGCAKKYPLSNGAYLYEKSPGNLYLYKADGQLVMPNFTTHFKISSDYIYGDTKSKDGKYSFYLYNTREDVLIIDASTDAIKKKIQILSLPELEMTTDITFGDLQKNGIKDLSTLKKLKVYPKNLTKEFLDKIEKCD